MKKCKIFWITCCMLFMACILIGCSQSSDAGSDDTYKTEAVPAFTRDTIRRFRLVQKGETVLETAYNPQDYKRDYEVWDVTAPYDSLVMIDTEVMYEAYDVLAALDFSQPVSEKPTEEELETYGLDAPDLIFEIDYFKGEDEEVLYQSIIHIGILDDNGKYYARVEGAEAVYGMAPEGIDALLATPAYDYILKITNLVHIETVETLSIRLDEEETVFTIDGGKEEYYRDDELLDKTEFHNLYTELMSVLLQKEIEKGKEGEGEVLLELEYTRNSEAAQDRTVQFCAYDDTYAKVNVNGKEFFLVNLDEVLALIEQIRSF